MRAIAREQGIPTHAKKDSTGICFIGERPFRDFLARYLPREPGPIETPEGSVVGRHSGLAYYTLGQRQGLGIGGTRDGSAAPWFVARKDMARNALIVVQGHEDPRLYSDRVETGALHWIAGDATRGGSTLARHDALSHGACGVRHGASERRIAGVCVSVRRNGRLRRASIWSSTMATYASVVASSKAATWKLRWNRSKQRWSDVRIAMPSEWHNPLQNQ